MSLELSELGPEDDALWDRAVHTSPHGTVAHTSPWLRLMERHTQSKLVLVAGLTGDEIMMGMPLFFSTRGPVAGCYSPPSEGLVSNLGPLIMHYDRVKQNKREFNFIEFVRAFDAYISDRYHPNLISIVTSIGLLDVRPFIWAGYSVKPRYTYIKRIDDLDGVWSGLKKELRNNIKDAEKKGLVVEKGGRKELEYILGSVSARMGDEGATVDGSQAYLLDLYDTVGNGNLNIFVVRAEDEPVSGIIVETFKDTVRFWIGAVQTSMKGLYPVDLLQWRIIQWANSQGYSQCELVGANIPSISYFKSRYNFDLALYFSIEKRSSFMRAAGRIRSLLF